MKKNPTARVPDAREFCHDALGERFAEALSSYDTQRRLEILIESFLSDEMVYGRRALDVGCGLGFFSARLLKRGADVTACDLGPGLVDRTREQVGCTCVVADALALVETFGPESFDLVVSSECIEHTPSPRRALAEMCRVLRPGGWLALSTPNVAWWPVVRLASLLRLRPFDGYENFSSWRFLCRTLRENGVEVVREHGLHLFPFQFGFHRLSRWIDSRTQLVRGVMINICILGRKVAE